MTIRTCALVVVALFLATPRLALAQRVSFERTYDVADTTLVDVSTIRGRIAVTAGEPGRVSVRGQVTVRTGFGVPENALELAHQVAGNPPIEQDGGALRLLPPREDIERRAVSISYQVTVPAGTTVRTLSDSGATTVRGVQGPVTVDTHTGAIELAALGGPTAVTSGSGAVTLDGVGGDLAVTTNSSAVRLRGVGAALRVRTESGAVDARLTGRGDVDVETGSSSIALQGVHGGLAVVTRSGSVRVTGAPLGPWALETGSSSIEVSFERGADFALEARSRSGSVRVEGLALDGQAGKDLAVGTVGRGGTPVHIESRSGSIRVDGR